MSKNSDIGLGGWVVIIIIGGIIWLVWHNINYHNSNAYQQDRCNKLAYATYYATSSTAFNGQRYQLLQSDLASCKRYWPTN